MSDSQSTLDLLAELQLETTKALLEKIKSRNCTAADLNVARQLLKDNGIEATKSANPALKELADELGTPSFEQEEQVDSLDFIPDGPVN